MKQITAFQTTDNKMFFDEAQAQAHQDELNSPKATVLAELITFMSQERLDLRTRLLLESLSKAILANPDGFTAIAQKAKDQRKKPPVTPAP
jgi:hypothetical protein